MSERTEIVPIGQLPDLGVVREMMHAYAIRTERFGEPKQSFQEEKLPVWSLASDEVLVEVMAASVNFNGIWAGLGTVSCLVGAPRPGLKNLEETRAAMATG
jgi:hypothetical protein